jgi:tetratricopeptide (TPR) repeat protein
VASASPSSPARPAAPSAPFSLPASRPTAQVPAASARPSGVARPTAPRGAAAVPDAAPPPPEVAPPTVEALGDALRAIGRGDLSLAEALGLSRQGLDLLLDKAQGLIRFDKLDEAEKLLVDLTRVDGRSPYPPFLLGALLATRGRHDEAIAAYDDAHRRAHDPALRALDDRIQLCRASSLLAVGDAFSARRLLGVVESSADHRVAEQAKKLLQAPIFENPSP